ncbi:MAG: tetraacyldisaccharide 4'-kinase [marine bacterium B5-7]|nr:MAG: tetraacyldisaccharide 4'-kinase [marine bacterium B5-7]
MNKHRFVNQYWYRRAWLSCLLLPLSGVFWLLTTLRRFAYRVGILRTTQLSVPVIVVGNIVVGGAGKTPLVIWLAKALKTNGYQPGILTRGYPLKIAGAPRLVHPEATADDVGDEALLLAKKTDCPVMVHASRVGAGQALLSQFPGCDVIISDDGLQHYALHRDIEIAVIDGERRCGNRFMLPAGPLREPRSRFKDVDFIVCNGKPLDEVKRCREYVMRYVSQHFHNVADPLERLGYTCFLDQPVHAVAGIGHPDRFFHSLREMGLTVIAHPFPDHHHFVASDFAFDDDLPVLMTEKDAVKCKAFAKPHYWTLPITVECDSAFAAAILEELKA